MCHPKKDKLSNCESRGSNHSSFQSIVLAVLRVGRRRWRRAISFHSHQFTPATILLVNYIKNEISKAHTKVKAAVKEETSRPYIFS
jgi:hypothetical protein